MPRTREIREIPGLAMCQTGYSCYHSPMTNSRNTKEVVMASAISDRILNRIQHVQVEVTKLRDAVAVYDNNQTISTYDAMKMRGELADLQDEIKLLAGSIAERQIRRLA